MKKVFGFFLTIGLFFIGQHLWAENSVGVTIGGPTFIHFSQQLQKLSYAEIGVSFSHKDASHIYGDYVLEAKNIFNNPNLQDIELFYGVGGMVVISNKDRRQSDSYYSKEKGGLGLGVRIPVGLQWRPAKAKQFAAHIQVNPAVAVVPETEVEILLGIGFKFYF